MKVKEFNMELPLLEYLKLEGLGRLQKSGCRTQGFHVHRYQKEGFVRYLPRESLKYQGYYWTKYGKYESESNRELREFETRNKLIRISDNERYIQLIEESLHDFKEYEYEYEAFYMAGVPVWTTETEWTSEPSELDEDEELTGRTRDCQHMYYGYRVVKTQNGNFRLEKSELVNDILSIKDRYPYIKEKFIEVVRGEPIDYKPVYQK